MKLLKISGIVLGLIVLTSYISFMLIIPNVIKPEKYKEEIQKLVKENSGLLLEYNSAQIYTHPLLKIGLKIDSPNISFEDNSKLFNAKDIDTRIDVLPLIFKQIKISKFQLKEPEINIDILKNGKYKFEELAQNNNENSQEGNEETKPQTENQNLDFIIILNNALADKYKLTVNDLMTNDSLTLSGDYININEFNSSKRIKLSAVGKAELNEKKDIDFNAQINYQFPKNTQSNELVKTNNETEEVQIPNIVQLFKIYEPKASINTNIKISGEGNDTKINGNFYINKFSLMIDKNRLPDSNLKLDFDDKNINIESELYVAKNEKFTMKGDINHGKKANINLDCKSDKIYLSSILSLAKGILNSLMIENDLDDFTVKGYILSDFNIKTDLKELSSNGSLKLSEGYITHKKSELKVSDLISTINFENNNIKIENTSADINGSKINVNGTIDRNSKTNIYIYTDKLEIGKLFNAFAPADIKTAFKVNSGYLTIKANMEGLITELTPKANLLLENFSIINSTDNYTLTNKQLKADLKADTQNNFSGNININGTNIRFPDLNLNIQSPAASLEFNSKDINIEPSDIYIDNTTLVMAGNVKNYLTYPEYKFQIKGNVNSKTIIDFLPKEILGIMTYSGKIPVNIQIAGDVAKTNLTAQALANSTNYIAPVTVNKLLNKSSVVNVDISLQNNTLTISDIGLYELSNNLSELNNTLSNNILNGYKVAQITGGIKNLDRNIQTIDNIKINFPASLNLSTPVSKDSKLMLKGALNINGATNQPTVTGNINISDISLPEFLTNANSVDVNLTESNINVKVTNLSVENSKFNCEINTPQKFTGITDVTTFNLSSSNIDADRLAVISDNMMKALEGGNTSQSQNTTQKTSSTQNAQSENIPVKISKGNIKIDKLTTGELEFTNINSPLTMNNNTIYLNGMTLNAYNGNISGDLSYNLISTLIKAKLTGSGIDANKFIGAAALIKNQIFGTLQFTTDIALSGVTYQEQMKSLKGNADFIVENGKLGSLGSIETFLSANNLMSQAIITTKLGAVINTVAPYNSSEFKALTGKVTLKDGIAALEEIKSSGDNMSLYLTGKMNLLNNNLQATIFGRLSSELANALGPISSVSTDKLISSIPGVGSYALTLFKALTITADENLLKRIPNLTKESATTKNFKVILNGNAEKPATIVKSFQWIQTQSEYDETKNNLSELLGNTTALKEQAQDIVNSIFNSGTTEKSSDNTNKNSTEKTKQNIQKGVTSLLNLLNENKDKE